MAATDALECDASSYPGGKSGSGIFQRIINLIPRHRVFVSVFAGHCGVLRNIRSAEHTIVIDQDPTVCEWWSKWSRSKRGRRLEIHCCDGIEWIRFRFGCTEYSVANASVAGSDDANSHGMVPLLSAITSRFPKACDADRYVTRATKEVASEYFLFCDPPYVIKKRRGFRNIYAHELSDCDHSRFLDVATKIEESNLRIMVCGYSCDLYSRISHWNSIDHRVPTRRGLQDERIWMNYFPPDLLHDFRYVGDDRRSRERIRRRQRNWREQLNQMDSRERLAMLDALNS